jgi:hypothetical protein
METKTHHGGPGTQTAPHSSILFSVRTVATFNNPNIFSSSLEKAAINFPKYRIKDDYDDYLFSMFSYTILGCIIVAIWQ